MGYSNLASRRSFQQVTTGSNRALRDAVQPGQTDQGKRGTGHHLRWWRLCGVAWVASIGCGCGATSALDDSSNLEATNGLTQGGANERVISGTGGGPSTLAKGGAPATCSPGNLSALPQGEGGAHLVALCACNECGWPAQGALCQSLMNALPLVNSQHYQSCWGISLPDCIREHADACATGIPAACGELWANQTECMSS